jgi:hypothetical protein
VKASLLYLFTAIVTGIFVSRTILGAPRNPLTYVSLFGSLVLAGAALAAPFRRRAAAIAALVGSGLAWCLFSAAIVYGARIPFIFWLDMKENIPFPFPDYVLILRPLVCPALLVASTVYAIHQLRHSQR